MSTSPTSRAIAATPHPVPKAALHAPIDLFGLDRTVCAQTFVAAVVTLFVLGSLLLTAVVLVGGTLLGRAVLREPHLVPILHDALRARRRYDAITRAPVWIEVR